MDVWSQIGRIPPRDLTAARLEIHHALQLVSIAVGRALIPPRDDDSHTALAWLDVPGQWVGEEVPGTGVRAGLRPADLVLTVGGKDDPAGQQLELPGRRRDEALDWLRRQLAEHGVDPARVVLDFHYEMPSHPLEEGAAWDSSLADGRAELARYFSAASQLIVEVSRGGEASPIVTWPHHFDMATLLAHGDGGERSVGIGLAAGDESYDEPYFYCSPYPRPDAALPDLPAGHWHTEGFFSAVLTASELLEGDDPETRAREYATAAIAASRRLLDA